MKKKLTREERRRRSQRRLQLITYLLFLLLLLAWLGSYLIMTVEAEPRQTAEAPAVICIPPPDTSGRLPGDNIPATERCYLTEDEQEAAENELIEAALLSRAVRLDGVTVTHYCPCSACCGKSDGVTASGRMATPGVSVAVDPQVIPLGSDVLVDYGDGEIKYYRADDTGAAVKGNHIDLCMESHEAALQAGVRTATVYYIKEGAV